MNQFIFRLLDCDNTREVELYETCLYEAFHDSKIPTVHKIWDVVSDNRMRMRIPYADQLIYIADLHGIPVSAIAYNTGKEVWQLDTMGFSLDKKEHGVLESLGVYSLEREYTGQSGLAGMQLKEFADRDLKSRGYEKYYGTASEKMTDKYVRHLGAQIIDTADFYGEKKFLLLMKI